MRQAICFVLVFLCTAITRQRKSEKDIVSLTPALTLKSEIAYIKTVPTGTAIGYGATFVTDHETVVATIPIGYGDGYPRALSNKGSILIHGKKAPILGRICMDQTMVDISDIPEAKEGDEVVVIGKSGDNELSAEEVSELAGSFNYELCVTLESVFRGFITATAK